MGTIRYSPQRVPMVRPARDRAVPVEPFAAAPNWVIAGDDVLTLVPAGLAAMGRNSAFERIRSV